MKMMTKNRFLCKWKTVLLKIMSNRCVLYLAIRLVLKLAQLLSNDE